MGVCRNPHVITSAVSKANCFAFWARPEKNARVSRTEKSTFAPINGANKPDIPAVSEISLIYNWE
jgi:hypothetical protein